MTYILTIAREGGITKAAAKLYLTQSALDQQLLKLEHELGTQLFCRARGSFAMTAAGEVYVKYAEQMVSLRNEAYRIIRDMADQRKGSLQVAFAPERGMEMFVHVYPRFYRDYPEITVVPSEMGVRRQLELLQPMEDREALTALVGKSLCGQGWAAKANVVFYWSFVCYRSEWRYGMHAHRMVMADVGHVGENLYLACTALGLGTCGIGAYDQKLCDTTFQLDGEEEFTLYSQSVGTVQAKDEKAEKAFYSFVEEQGL